MSYNEQEWATDEGQYGPQLEREADRERDAHYDAVYAALESHGLDLIERVMSPGGRD